MALIDTEGSKILKPFSPKVPRNVGRVKKRGGREEKWVVGEGFRDGRTGRLETSLGSAPQGRLNQFRPALTAVRLPWQQFGAIGPYLTPHQKSEVATTAQDRTLSCFVAGAGVQKPAASVTSKDGISFKQLTERAAAG